MAVQEVKLPDIGEGVTEGEMVKWLVKVGDIVKPDQAVAEVLTDKATVEVPSPYAGKVKELKVKEGAMVPIESVMLLLDSEGAASTASAAPAPAPMMAAAPAQSMKSTSPSVGVQSPLEVYPPAAESRVLATPATRRLAREMGVDINQLHGTGIAGRVTRDDVTTVKGGAGAVSGGWAKPATQIPKLAFASQNAAAEERVALRGVRKKIAENLQMAKHIIPHFTLVEEANVSELVKMRASAKEQAEKSGVKVTYLPFVMKALLATMRDFPMFNASIDDAAAEIVYKHYFNLGFAADTPNGLLVPVVKAADQKTILQISKDIQELAFKARDGKLSLDEMKGATITITNIGSVGGLYATPIINHPEVAILGMYKIQTKPVWNGKEFVPHEFMNFSITCDHRLIDGAVAANFMKAFVGRIENPSRLMLDMI